MNDAVEGERQQRGIVEAAGDRLRLAGGLRAARSRVPRDLQRDRGQEAGARRLVRSVAGRPACARRPRRSPPPARGRPSGSRSRGRRRRRSPGPSAPGRPAPRPRRWPPGGVGGPPPGRRPRSPRGCAAARPSTPAAPGHRSPPCGRRRRPRRPSTCRRRRLGRGSRSVGLVRMSRLQARAAPGRGRRPSCSTSRRARPAQDGERVALAAGAVQREGQQPPGVLAPGVLGHVGVQVRHRLGGPAEREPRLGPPLDRVQPQLGQAGALGAGPVPRRRTRRTRARATAPAPRPAAAAHPWRGSVAAAPTAASNRQASTASGSARSAYPALGDQQPGGRPGRALGLQRSPQRGDEGADRARRRPAAARPTGRRRGGRPGRPGRGRRSAAPAPRGAAAPSARSRAAAARPRPTTGPSTPNATRTVPTSPRIRRHGTRCSSDAHPRPAGSRRPSPSTAKGRP